MKKLQQHRGLGYTLLHMHSHAHYTYKMYSAPCGSTVTSVGVVVQAPIVLHIFLAAATYVHAQYTQPSVAPSTKH